MRVGSVAARQGQDTPTCGTTVGPSLHGPQSDPALEAPVLPTKTAEQSQECLLSLPGC